MNNNNSVLEFLNVISTNKDSVRVTWSLKSNLSYVIEAFDIRYQAIGSNVVQYTGKLPASAQQHNLLHLHENTNYEICLSVLTSGPAPSNTHASQDYTGELDFPHCVTGSASVDSFKVAVGSTLAALLVLSIIVGLVLLAQCQGDGGDTTFNSKRRQRKAYSKFMNEEKRKSDGGDRADKDSSSSEDGEDDGEDEETNDSDESDSRKKQDRERLIQRQ